MLLLIVSHGSLQFMMFKFYQAKYKSDIVNIMMNGRSNSDLITFKFKKNDFKKNTNQMQWTDDEEFMYNKIMYDVINKKVIDDIIYLSCIQDDNETVLYSYFNEFLDNLSEEDPDKLKDITSINIFLSQLYSNSISSEDVSVLELNKNHFANLTTNTLEREEPLITPPPRS